MSETTLNPSNSTLKAFTKREGMLSPIGHDLCLVVNEFEIQISSDGLVEGWADPKSLKVSGSWDGSSVVPMGKSDRKKIEKKVLKDVFGKPEKLGFSGTSEEIELRGAMLSVSADGKTRTVVLSMKGVGLQPVTAFFGALRVHDSVRITLESELFSASEE